MNSRKAVGSLIGIGFLLMILAVGFSYYNIISRIEDSTQNTINEMMAYDRDAADEDLEITSVKLTVGNSLNLTIKNTGNEFSELEWVGVFDETLNTQDYYSLDASLNPVETQKDIGNVTIVMDPLNDYTIQVLTKLGNMYYGEYPDPVDTGAGVGGGGNNTSPYYSDYEISDLHPETTLGVHSLFGAMKAGPDTTLNTLSEEATGGGFSNQTLIDNESFEGAWLPAGWSEVAGNSRWNKEGNQEYDGASSADFDGGEGQVGDLMSPVMDCSTSTAIYVTFWYYDDDLEPTDLVLEYFDGTSWDPIANLGADAEDTWHYYQQNVNDPQYMISDFQIRWVATTDGKGEHIYVDLVNVIKTAPTVSYELDLEVLWSNLPSLGNEYLMVYGETQGAEALQIDVWNGAAWVTVVADVQIGWNTVDVSTYLTGSTLNIRFKDTVQVSDLVQESWEIDALILNLFD